jgi:hypothetical protein
MPLVNKSIPNLINGVSQQPDTLRLSSQAESQTNGFSSVVEGLRKRPPTSYVAKISSSNLDGAFIHTINRDSNERYIVTITNGAIQVNAIDGTTRTVSTPDGVAYLSSSNPYQNFRALTVADFTFIVNNTITTAKGTTTSPAKVQEAIYSIKQAVVNTKYSIILNGTTYSTTTASSGDDSSDIVDNLITAIGSVSNFSFTNLGSSIHIRNTAGADFTVKATDGYGDQASQVIKDKAQNFTDLPSVAVNNMVVEITNTAENNFDNYYVKFESGNNNDEGLWVETVEPNSNISFDASTMPHQLVRNADGTFTFQQVTYGDREVGDSESAEDPSFIGSKINDIFFHRNRLGFLSSESVVMSRASEFFDFYPETVTDVLDTDPIDISVSHTKVSILRHAIPFNEELLVFSDQTQFTISGANTITAKNVTSNVSTEFDNNQFVKPVSAGRQVYFAFNKGEFSGIREYFTNIDGDTNDANDITDAVPKYIPKNLQKLAVASNENILIALSKDEPNALYVYQYYYANNEKLQSAWHKWTYGNTTDTKILNLDFIETTLYILLQRSDGVYIESLEVAPAVVDTGSTYLTHLDSKIDESTSGVSTSYNSGTNQTTITIPYAIDNTMQVVTRFVSGNSTVAGVVIPTVSQVDGGTSIVVNTDITAKKFFIGEKYTFNYELSTQFIKTQDSETGSKSSIKEGRLQIRNFTVSFNNTGFFKTKVTPFRRDTSTDTFSGAVVSSTKVNDLDLQTGDFKFSVQSKNENLKIEFENDSFLPSNFVNAEWEGFFHQRGRNI